MGKLVYDMPQFKVTLDRTSVTQPFRTSSNSNLSLLLQLSALSDWKPRRQSNNVISWVFTQTDNIDEEKKGKLAHDGTVSTLLPVICVAGNLLQKQ